MDDISPYFPGFQLHTRNEAITIRLYISDASHQTSGLQDMLSRKKEYQSMAYIYIERDVCPKIGLPPNHPFINQIFIDP